MEKKFVLYYHNIDDCFMIAANSPSSITPSPFRSNSLIIACISSSEIFSPCMKYIKILNLTTNYIKI